MSSSYLTEVDFLARVEAAERRDNMSANPSADPAPKYSAAGATAPSAALASSCSCSGAAMPPASAPAAQKAASAPAARRPMQQRTSPTREHRIHDETGGAGSRLALAAQGRPPSSHRGQTSGRGGSKRGAQGVPRGTPRGTPRPGGANPAAHSRETTPRPRVETTPRPPYVSAHGVGGRLSHPVSTCGGGGATGTHGNGGAMHRMLPSAPAAATAAAPSSAVLR